ncbi:MAG TPA: ABC transporter permease [Thermoplasmata archaeon]
MPQNFAAYTARRLVYLAITVFLILTFNFLLFRVLPGDPTDVIIQKGASPEVRERLTEYYGLDEPLFTQFVIYMRQLLSGDFGESYGYPGTDVIDMLLPATANTLVLVGTGTVMSIVVGVVFGRESAWRRGKATDKVLSTFSLVFYCMPTFLFALVMLMVTVNYFPSWPSHGTTSEDYTLYGPLGKTLDRLQHLLLPLIALVIETIAVFSIITKSSLIDVLTEDYMVTAVAKGLRGREILKRHAMPNAMLPVVTVIALNVGWVLSGSIMIEIVFTYKGLGYLTWEAVWGRDYPMLQTAFLLEIVAVLVANLIADMLLFRLDPRVKV